MWQRAARISGGHRTRLDPQPQRGVVGRDLLERLADPGDSFDVDRPGRQELGVDAVLGGQPRGEDLFLHFAVEADGQLLVEFVETGVDEGVLFGAE